MTDFESQYLTRQESSSDERLQPGLTVGKYRLLDHLGEGGMGSVWSAEDPLRKDDTRDGRVVLKFLRDDIRRCPEAMEDFCAAYRRTQELHHTHICPLLDLGYDDTFGQFQVMRFISGVTLLQWWRKVDPDRSGLPIEQVVEILTPVAAALDHAHAEKLIHRDVKPGNIMLQLDGDRIAMVFVVDFGLAAEVRTSMSMHSRASMGASGTEPYMAPEQWQGQVQDGRSDQYSLAVTAWQLLTGSLPYQGTGLQLGFAVMNGELPQMAPPLAHLQSVFERAMHKDRKRRFRHVSDFLNALGGPADASDPPPAEPEAAQPSVAVTGPVQSGVGSDEDLAALLQKTQENVSRLLAQATELMEQHYDYAGAVKVLDQIPEHLREPDLYEKATHGARRVKELDQSIRVSVKEVRLAGVREQIEELLELQPSRREPLERLLAQLPKEPPKPRRPALLTAPFDAATARVSQQVWADHLGIDVEVTNGLGMKFRVVPPGTFLMGSPADEEKRFDNEAQHEVTITQPKLVGIYPVTRGEWRQLMGNNPSHFDSVSGQDTDRFPVEQESWDEREDFWEDFIAKLNTEHVLAGWRYRLPTEAEWEWFCRAGTTTPFHFGKTLNGTEANCCGELPYGSGEGPYLDRPSVVGSYSANAFGLYDCHGNVWEWCSDWYDKYYYMSSPSEDPIGPSSGLHRALRGGSWDGSAGYCRSAFRGPHLRPYRIGLRLLCELS